MSLDSVEKGVDDSAVQNRIHQLTESVSIHALADDQFAVRDLRTKSYFRVGQQEAFLLEELRIGTTFDRLREKYTERFREELERADFDSFLKLLSGRRLLRGGSMLTDNATDPSANRGADQFDDDDDDDSTPGRGGSVLYYRFPLVNPNRFLRWFVDTFPFFWTKVFVGLSTATMLVSLCVLFASASDLLVGFQNAIRWESLLIGVVAIVSATAIHELGHGATCKRYGGEVTEAGFLFLFFMPCLYVNVSDAWIIREKWKRLAITLAGGYCDLCIWAVSVLVWRLTEMDSSINYIALVLLTTCGSRSLMNFNPLIRLDGYYLLSDILEYPNLYRQSRRYWIGTLNWFLWGAKRPEAPRLPMFSLVYGMVMWSFGLGLLSYVGWQLLGMARMEFGFLGSFFVCCLLYYGVRRVFRGLIGVETVRMITKRTRRFVAIALLIAAACAATFWIPYEYASSGNFEVRPAGDIDISSPVHSFIATVLVQDGQPIECGQTVVELHAPDLVAQLAAKQAELANAKATLAKLAAGPRQEEIRTLERRVSLLKDWCNLGSTELDATKKSHEFELKSLEEKAKQIQLQIELAETVLQKTQELKEKGAVAGAQIVVEKSQLEVLRSQLQEVESKRSSLAAAGVNNAIAELSHRQRQLNDAESELMLMKLGTRAEEIDAATARVTMLDEELTFLKDQQSKLVVRTSTAGIVSAPRLNEKVGQFAPKGLPICRIELPGTPRVELLIPETEATLIKTGQKVRLKARSLPFETIHATVERIAPVAFKPIDAANAAPNPLVRKTIAIHCTLDESEERLKSGMTGVGRVSCGVRSLGEVAVIRLYQYIRTEFWW